jgi:RNA polymerase sigma-70 factor (ECF subfamily)
LTTKSLGFTGSAPRMKNVSAGKRFPRPFGMQLASSSSQERGSGRRLIDGDSLGMPENRSQAEVLRGAVEGKPWAYAALYDALYPFVARSLQKILYRPPDYEDLVQASFELIVRTLRRPRSEPIENLATWASTIAARVALDALRARVRERRLFSGGLEPTRMEERTGAAAPSLQAQLDARSELLWLQETLGSMNAEQAEAILLHDVLEHDLSEVAKLTGVSEAAAQKRLSRGHLELKRRAKARRGEVQ